MVCPLFGPSLNHSHFSWHCPWHLFCTPRNSIHNQYCVEYYIFQMIFICDFFAFIRLHKKNRSWKTTLSSSFVERNPSKIFQPVFQFFTSMILCANMHFSRFFFHATIHFQFLHFMQWHNIAWQIFTKFICLCFLILYCILEHKKLIKYIWIF